MAPVPVLAAASVCEDDLSAEPEIARPARQGRMDRYTRLALAVAQRALGAARIDPHGIDDNRTGIVLGTALGCYEANAQHLSAMQKGEVSPSVFAATLPSTPIAEIAIHLGLRGPQVAFAQGADAALIALAEGRRWIVQQRAELVIVCAVEALRDELRRLYPAAPADGAHAWILASRPGGASIGNLHGGGQAFGVEARARAISAARREAAFPLPPATCHEAQEGLREALGCGRPTLLVAEDPLGGTSALIVS